MENKKLELICGRLGADPKIAYTKKREAVCEFSIALNGENNETIWRKIVAWEKLAEICSVHLKKGQEIFVRGQTTLRKFTTKEGVEKEYLELRAYTIGQSLV